jgi:hypothetical protein
MIPKVLEKQFSKVDMNNTKKKKKKKETREERLSRIADSYGLKHGKGKRKKRTKKRGGSK